MKLVKILFCMALSFSFIVVGVGFAQLSAELDFTGLVRFQHTGLYISSVSASEGVHIKGYSGTLFTLSAEASSTMRVSITNPLSTTYYYLNYSAGNATLETTAELGLGKALDPEGTITFTVTFPEAIAQEQAVKFNFTLIPPSAEEEDPDSITTNATAAVEFIINNVSHGLNANDEKHTIEQWCNKDNRVLYCRDNSVAGSNLDKEFQDLGATNVYYTLEWISETQYNSYLYYKTHAESNPGSYIVAYKQEVIYNSIDGKWVNGDSFKGYAKAIANNKGNYIETGVDEGGNACVIWYDSEAALPDGAVVVS